jgi:hypothetical protein
VAALALVPVAGFAARKRWGAFVLGASLVVLALSLVPIFFVHFADEVSISQARRAAGFMPLPFAFGGGLAVLSRSIFLTPLALIAGIVLQLEWPGDFGYGLTHGGTAWVTWFAFAGGAVALTAGLVWARRRRVERYGRGAVAAGLFVLPVAVYGFSHWSPTPPAQKPLSATLRQELKRVPPRAVIIAAPLTSYELVAAAPVYVVAAPPTHVAATKANDPRERVQEVDAWLDGRAPGVPKKYGATWAVRNGRLYKLPA